MAAERGTPARSRLRAAVLRKARTTGRETPAALQALVHVLRKSPMHSPSTRQKTQGTSYVGGGDDIDRGHGGTSNSRTHSRRCRSRARNSEVKGNCPPFAVFRLAGFHPHQLPLAMEFMPMPGRIGFMGPENALNSNWNRTCAFANCPALVGACRGFVLALQ
jgi:hypothetical protein